MEATAYKWPTKVEVAPSVAELPMAQKTLQACAPFANTMVLLVAVVNVDEGDCITNIAFGSPWASKVTDPEFKNALPVL